MHLSRRAACGGLGAGHRTWPAKSLCPRDAAAVRRQPDTDTPKNRNATFRASPQPDSFLEMVDVIAIYAQFEWICKAVLGLRSVGAGSLSGRGDNSLHAKDPSEDGTLRRCSLPHTVAVTDHTASRASISTVRLPVPAAPSRHDVPRPVGSGRLPSSDRWRSARPTASYDDLLAGRDAALHAALRRWTCWRSISCASAPPYVSPVTASPRSLACGAGHRLVA